MSTVKEIETAISKLSHHELVELRAWLAEFEADAWDRQMEEDAQSGRLDAFYQRLQRENEGQPEVPLDDFLNEEELS
jgi:hypothetical protein